MTQPTETPTIPIHEKFFAFQGEGDYMGVSAYFIRTFGCPLACPWCDSAGTWHKDYIPDKINRQSVSVLADAVDLAKPKIVVITGGEPTIHKSLPDLVSAIQQRGYPVHLETSGAFDTDANFDWITLSPKWSKLPKREMIMKASEIKIIVEDEHSIEKWIDQMFKIAGEPWMEYDLPHRQTLWLHPEWSQRNNPKVLNSISEFIKSTGMARAGYQLHKLYQVDSLDKGTRELAPLGGDPERGY